MDKLIICIVVFVHFHLFDARFYQNSEVPANAFLQSTSFTAGNIASCLLSCDRIGTNCHGVTFNDQLEHLKLHNKFGHISFHLLKNMAQQKLIPHKLAKVEPPKCSSCLYGKKTKSPWRTKAMLEQLKEQLKRWRTDLRRTDAQS